MLFESRVVLFNLIFFSLCLCVLATYLPSLVIYSFPFCHVFVIWKLDIPSSPGALVISNLCVNLISRIFVAWFPSASTGAMSCRLAMATYGHGGLTG